MLNANLEKKQSELIEAIRFPLIVLIVFIHVLPEKLVPLEMSFSGMNIYHIISESFFKYLRKYGIIILITLYLATWELHIKGLSMTAFMFFGLGTYWGIYKKNILEFCFRFKFLCGIGSLFFLLGAVFNNGHELSEFFARPFVLFGVVTAINIMNWVIGHEFWKKKLCYLSATVFFIYAVHEIYIINWTKVFFLRTFLVNSEMGLVISYVLIPTITISVCLGLYSLLSRIAPRTLAFLIGGRVKTQVTGGGK